MQPAVERDVDDRFPLKRSVREPPLASGSSCGQREWPPGYAVRLRILAA
jgi:hypothetical protein